MQRSHYRWPRAAVLRPFGRVVAALGVLWIFGVGVAFAGGIGSGLASGAWIGALIVTTAVLAAGVWFLTRPPLVLELSSKGYRIHHVRGSEVAAADWRQVESVQTRSSDAGRCVVVSLAGDRRSIVPLPLLGQRAAEAEREIHDRLNSAHGYRPLGA